ILRIFLATIPLRGGTGEGRLIMLHARLRSDARLVERALAEDAGAFEALVRRHQKRAHAIARAVGVRGAAVDDVVQEAFFAAFRGLRSLKDPKSFGGWLLAIVRNH